MRTACPECGSSIDVTDLGTDPGATRECSGCQTSVRPGLFLCPHCATGLQVNRHLLPPGGARGHCPSCSGMIRVAGLESAAMMEEPMLATAAAAPAAPDPLHGAPVGETATEASAVEDVPAAPEEDPGNTTRMESAALTAGAQEPDRDATLRLSAQDMAAAVAPIEDNAASPGAIEVLEEPSPTSPDAGEDDIEATQRLAVDEIPAEPPSEELGATRRLDIASFQGEMASEPPSESPQASSAKPSPVTEEPGGTAKLTAVPPAAVTPRPKRPLTAPARRPPVPARGSGKGRAAILGLLLGGGLAGGGGYAAGSMELFEFPQFPFAELVRDTLR